MDLTNVAVIIPTYNRSNLVAKAVSSCFTQNTPAQIHISVVVVDDGSTDNTADYLKQTFSLVKQENHMTNGSVYYLKITNSERGAARNRGAEFALNQLNVDWLIFLDADDVFTENCFAAVAPFLKDKTYILSSKFLLWDGEKTYGSAQPETPSGKLSTLEGFKFFLGKSHLAISTTFVPANVFMKSGGFSENRLMSGSEDWLFLAKITLLSPIKYIEKVTHLYRQHEGNTKPQRTEQAISALHAEFKPFLKNNFGKDSEKLFRKCFLKQQLMIIGAYNSAGINSIAWNKMWNLLKDYPSMVFQKQSWLTILSLLKRKIANNTSH